MVLPMALMLGGAGLQMFGQDQRSQAQDTARAAYGYSTRINQAGQEFGQDQTNAVLGNLGDQWMDSNQQAVDDLSAANMRGGFNTGSSELQARIDAVMGSTPLAGQDTMQAAGQNTAMINAQQRQKMSNDRRTAGLTEVLKNNAGLAGLSEVQRTGMADKGDRDSQIKQRINDILRLQNYADAVRNTALQKAGAEHSLDQARAASVGSGAMYLGALMGGVGGTMGQPGQPGMTQPPGAFGNPVNGVDGPRPRNPNSQQA